MEKELAGINKSLFGNNDETLISLIDSGINSRPERGRTDILGVSTEYRSGFLSRPAPHRTFTIFQQGDFPANARS